MPWISRRGAYNLTPTAEELANYDFTDKSSLVGEVWRINIAFIVLVSVFVSLRVFTRASITRQFFVDDVLAIFATLFILVSSATSIVATRYGLGMHVWNLEPPLDSIMVNIQRCVQVCFCQSQSLSSSKLSVADP